MSVARRKLIKALDRVFSRFIRKRNADSNGTTSCFTCGKVDHWKAMHAGHFQGRIKMCTRWDEENVQVQCVRCNIFLHGNQFQYGKELDKKYGEGKSDELQLKSNQSCRISQDEMRQLIKKYSVLLSDFPD